VRAAPARAPTPWPQVNLDHAPKDDKMETFWLAESLKYLLPMPNFPPPALPHATTALPTRPGPVVPPALGPSSHQPWARPPTQPWAPLTSWRMKPILPPALGPAHQWRAECLLRFPPAVGPAHKLACGMVWRRYFLLLFSDDALLDLNTHVLNTEAHPLQVLREG